MDYSVSFDGETYELPAYNFGMAEELEKIDGTKDLKEKCKLIYNFAQKNVLKEKTEEVLGDFENADPNALVILHANICRAYQEPVEMSTMKMVSERISSGDLDKVVKLMEQIEKIK